MTNPKEVLAHYKSEWESRVMNMKPGRELDALVAEYVMGWASLWTDGEYYMMYPPSEQKLGVGYDERHPVPYYSSDISAAWDVLRHLKGYHIELVRHRGVWTAALDDGKRSFVVRANSAPEAICKAALLAVMDGEDEHERD